PWALHYLWSEMIDLQSYLHTSPILIGTCSTSPEAVEVYGLYVVHGDSMSLQWYKVFFELIWTGRVPGSPPWGKPWVSGGRRELACCLPCPAAAAFLHPQASLPSRMPWLEGEGPPSSGGCSRLCAGLSAA
ncbi:unnamed protein product, partial [Bubo scandiacus]